MSTLLRPDQSHEKRGSNSSLTIPGRPPDRQKPLNLLGKTLPIPVATPPELRTRRQFVFNGMRYETNGLWPSTQQQQQKQQQLQQQQHRQQQQYQQQQQKQRQQQRQEPLFRMSGGANGSGGGHFASREQRMRGGTNTINSTIIDTMGTYENAGGDNGLRLDQKKTVPPKRLNRDTALPINSSARMPVITLNRCSSEMQMKSSARTKYMPAGVAEAGTRLSKAVKYSSRTKVQEELDDEVYPDQDEEHLGKVRKRYPSNQQPSTPKPPIEEYGAKQRLMFAQSMMKEARNGSGSGGGTLIDQHPPSMVIPGIGGAMPSKMDYITLAGLVLGCIASHALYFLCWYFSWLKNQVVGLRKRFLGHANLWDFFDLDDTSRYSVQTKLLLVPLIIAGALLYCVVNMLHMLVQVVRSDVPRTVVVFVQRVVNSGLLGTITMGLGGGGVGAFRRPQ
ncbi:ras-interacting protein RIP3 [Drosophila serrata]|uniref:ras-interacting protein RIP3 n=1 Tax=Drosophila serrata TaxID=7274 RepID=UPI000A1D06F3|nr:ras-interacting protein RIP3 [Drosophila serrata]